MLHHQEDRSNLMRGISNQAIAEILANSFTDKLKTLSGGKFSSYTVNLK